MHRAGMREGAEFRKIRGFVDSTVAPAVDEVLVGPGDDAAVLHLPAGQSLVISTDLSVEGVHFRRAWMTWTTIGYRAVAAAFSDLAAMAAHPLGATVSLAMPPELDDGVGEEIARGVGECLREQGASLLGGDLSRSPGPVVIDVCAVGRSATPVERMGAVAGDELWVTGELGGAAAAVAALSTGLDPAPSARRRLERPTARTVEAVWLAERVAIHAMIDLSDGLAADSQHLCAASGVGLEIRLEGVPLHPVLADRVGEGTAMQLACGGGEDYELLLAVAPGHLEGLASDFERRFDVRLSRIGSVTQGSYVVWLDETGSETRPPAAGFDHFETRS